eukprot:7848877-Alexandrium_andersonii.AAC.1
MNCSKLVGMLAALHFHAKHPTWKRRPHKELPGSHSVPSPTHECCGTKAGARKTKLGIGSAGAASKR